MSSEPTGYSASHSPLKRMRVISPQSSVVVHASDNPVRQVLTGLVSTIYKVSAMGQSPEPGLSTLWQSLKKLDLQGVNDAIKSGADLNERDVAGDTPLHFIARQGHYKYPPSDIPQVR